MTRWHKFWAWPWELRQRGVLGINERNLFIAKDNLRSLYPRVDDKVLTKEICKRHAIPIPETYAIIERLGDVRRLTAIIGSRREFVIKPARGAAGRGIMVIARTCDTGYATPGETLYTPADVRYQIATILAGLYSLAGRPDRAIIEQRIKPHVVFEKLAIRGTPDIRIVLHRGNPVMAMIRLPTSVSGGRANLHQGAVGAGIDLKTGITSGGVLRGRAVTIHPDTNEPLAGAQIPHWSEILSIATKLSKAIELNYLGVDIVLDADHGPFVLEANARPGLAIQIANSLGLADKLDLKI